MTTAPATTPRTTTIRLATITELLLAVLASVVGFGSYIGYFGSLWWMVPTLAAILIGAGLGVLFVWRCWSGWLLTPAAAVLLVIFQIYALHPKTTTYGVPGLATVTALRDGLLSGWIRMLTVALPADPTGDLLATPTFLALVAGVLTAILVLRSRAVIALAAAPVLVLTSGLLLTASRPEFGVPVTTALLVVLAVLLLIRTNRLSATRHSIIEAAGVVEGVDPANRRRHSATGGVLIGLPAVAVIIAVAIAGGIFLPIAGGSQRADPRVLVSPEINLTTELSPLVEVKPQLTADQPTDLYRVTVLKDNGQNLSTIRIAALDSFDGALWSQSGDFITAGSKLPQPTPAEPNAVDVSLQVEVLTNRTPFLPVLGTPTQTSGISTAIEPKSGTLISLAAATGGAVPTDLTYDLTSLVTPLAGLDGAAVGSAPEDARLPPNPPAWVSQTAAQLTNGWQTPFERLKALEAAIFAHRYSIDARPGESYGAIYRVLLGSDADQYGYDEQYASAFAVLARALGYPSRIAVGYKLSATSRSGNTYTVTTADAHAWPEILLAGYGWVGFEPTNVQNNAQKPPVQDTTLPTLPDHPQQPQVAQPDSKGDQGGNDVAASGFGSTMRLGLLIALGVIVMVLLLVGLIIAAKTIRRSRRRSTGQPAHRIAASWQEIHDRLRESGNAARSSQTPLEVAESIAKQPGGHVASTRLAVDEMAVIVTNAVCSPAAPTQVAARRAWTLYDQISKALGEHQPPLVRILTLIDPRPLWPGGTRLRAEPAPSKAAGTERPADRSPARSSR